MLNRPFTKSKNSLSKQGFVQNLSSENEFHFMCMRIKIIIFIEMALHGLLSLWKSSGGSRGGARGSAPPPLFFDRPPLPLSQGLDDPTPPLPLIWRSGPPTEERLEETRKSPPSQNVWFLKMQLKLTFQKKCYLFKFIPPCGSINADFRCYL